MSNKRRNRRRRPAHSLGIAVFALGLAVAAGSAAVRGAHSTGASEGRGGAGLSAPAWPKRLTDGDSVSRIFGPAKVLGAEARGSAATELEASKPRFTGVLAGVHIVDPHAATSLQPCARDHVSFLGEAMLRAQGSFVEVTPASLPRGTFEIEAPFGEACDGKVVTVSRQFQLLPYGGSLGVVRRFGTTIVPIAASRDRIRTGSVNGQEAVFVLPVTPEGFGDSAIVVAWGGSVTVIAGDSVPFDQLLRAAQGVI